MKNEKDFFAKACQRTDRNIRGDPLSVICAVNENARKHVWKTHGIRDEEFIRGKAPMTKGRGAYGIPFQIAADC